MKIEIPENAMVIVASDAVCIAKDFADKILPNDLRFSIDSNLDEKFLSHLHQCLSNNSSLTICCLPDQETVNQLLLLCKEFYIKPILFLLKFSTDCVERNHFRSSDITNSFSDFKYHIKEKSKKIYVFNSEKEANKITSVVRKKLKVNSTEETGPFDIIGDIHGCFEELRELLIRMNYKIEKISEDYINFGYKVTPPPFRKVVFLGDLVDRGPHIMDTLKLVMSMVNDGIAHCVMGNHDEKFLRKLKGRNVEINHGLEMTIDQLANESKAFKEKVKDFLNNLPLHLVFEEGKLVAVHAGIKEKMIGKVAPEVKEFCLYGESTGEKDEYGLPVRINWAKDYNGKAMVVYGHTAIENPEWVNNTLDIDAGCVFGGKLTALRYPELAIVTVNAKKEYISLLKTFSESRC